MYTDAILSIGWHIFAIWSESNPTNPVFWRRRDSIITSAEWSSTRISMFFLALHDSVIEIWDILIRTDIPIISYDSGGVLITTIMQHTFSLSNDTLFVADGKAFVRTFILPSSWNMNSTKEDKNVSSRLLYL